MICVEKDVSCVEVGMGIGGGAGKDPRGVRVPRQIRKWYVRQSKKALNNVQRTSKIYARNRTVAEGAD